MEVPGRSSMFRQALSALLREAGTRLQCVPNVSEGRDASLFVSELAFDAEALLNAAAAP